MKRLLMALCLLLAVNVMAEPDQMKSAVLGMTPAFKADHSNAVDLVLLDLWNQPDTPACRAWVDSGWQEWVKTANTNITVLIYHVTVEQVKSGCEPGDIAKWKAWLDDSPQADVFTTWNFSEKMIELGLELKNKGDIE